MTDHLHALPEGSELEGYRIERVLGVGGFGITYLAVDTDELGKRFAIKEYLPNEFAVRAEASTVLPKSSGDKADFDWGLERFLDEAKTLATFKHPNLNQVYRFFRANGTAYMVLEYEEGETLSARLKREPTLPEADLLRLLESILSGLEVVHRAGFVHRDIKPGNIILRPDGTPVLLDFGAARAAMGQRSKSITAILTPGYAPVEQYDQTSDDIGPWTDIYALGMVAYRCVTGASDKQLYDAVARARLIQKGEEEKDLAPAETAAKGQYSVTLLRAIDHAIRVNEKDRPQTVQDWQHLLGEVSAANTAHSAPPVTKGRKPFPLMPVLVGVIALTLVGVLVLQFTGRDTPASVVAEVEQAREIRLPFEPEMVKIPAGTFQMGDLSGSGNSDEKPVHSVRIKSFYLGKYEVTFEQYDAFVRATGRERPGDEGWGRNNRPVINVYWEDAVAYADWLSQKTGKQYRLPTEAEWEYAARAGSETEFSWGNAIGHNKANCDGCGSQWDYQKTAPVGSFQPNAFGLHDLPGNVWEWTQDCSHESYAGAPANGTAWTNGGVCDRRAVRGGSWYFSGPGGVRSAARFWVPAAARGSTLGFRLVQDP